MSVQFIFSSFDSYIIVTPYWDFILPKYVKFLFKTY